MSNEPLIVEKVYNVPATDVWSAITDIDEIRQWYFQLEDFKAEPGFKFSFTGGHDDGVKYVHLCEVKEVVPGRKLTYSWRYEGFAGDSVVSWELEAQGDKTLLRITHFGLQSLEINGPDFARSCFNGGWNYFANEALVKYLEKESFIK